MASFDDLKTALDIEQFVRRTVQDELSKRRPTPRYAVVNSIDLADRSIMGTFVGDSDPVRIPLLDVIPSEIGQEVRVTGTGHDRAVDGIRGTSDAEARVAELESEIDLRQPIFGSWHRETNGTVANGLTKLAWTSQAFAEVGMNPLSSGGTEAIIPADGYYEVSITACYSTNTDKNFYVQCIPADASASYDILRVGSEMSGDNFGITDISISGTRKWYLKQGDRLCVNVGSAGSFTLYGGRTSTFWEIKRLYGGPLITA